jgi:hypothetical protein
MDDLSKIIRDEIFKSIHLITDAKLREADFSSYLISAISYVDSSDPYHYKIRYQGNDIDVYSIGGQRYKLNDSVIVLYSNADFNKKKIILSSSSLIGDTVSNGGSGSEYFAGFGISSGSITSNFIDINAGTGLTFSSGIRGTSRLQTVQDISVTASPTFANVNLRDTAAAFDLTLRSTSSPALTANRILTFNVENSARSIILGGNINIDNNFSTAGNFGLTLTTTAATNVTLPTSGTLYGTLANSITSAQLLSSVSDSNGTGTLVFESSPALSGTPLSTTAAVNTNTTQIATTAFVVGQASATNPLGLGTVAIGTSLRYARQDHVHPTTGLGLTSGTLAQFASTTSAQLAGVISDETGTGSLVFGTSPTFTTPRIASASSINDSGGNELIKFPAAVASAVNELNISNSVTGQPVTITTSGNDTNIGLTISTKGAGAIILDTGTGAGQIDLKAGASSVRLWDDDSTHYYQFVTGNRTANYNVTFPAGNVTLQAGTMAITGGTLGQFASTTSAQLAGVISDETGTGALVFGTSPTITNSLVTGSATFGLLDTTVTTLNFAGTATTLNLGYDGTAASTTNINTGAALSTSTKTINIGTGGASGSIASINIGSATAGAKTVIDIDGVGTADILIDGTGLDAAGVATEPAIYPDLSSYGSLGKVSRSWFRIYSLGTYNRTVTSSVRSLFVDNTGLFGGVSSSRRFKEDIKDFNIDFEALLKLEPKTYFYNFPDTDRVEPQIGFIAEQAQELGLDFLYQVDKDGIPDYFAYEKLPIYLLGLAKQQQQQIEELKNEINFLKQHLNQE